jgi:hypothetical protein
MADFSVTPIAQTLKPPTPMSLADMVNLASGVQQYKQAQQLNPLAVQRAGAELSRLQQLTPEELRRAQAAADQAESEAEVSGSTVKPRISQATSTAASAESTAAQDRIKLLALKQRQIANSQIALINHPLVIAAEKDPSSVDVVALQNLVNQSGINMGRDLGFPETETANLNQPYMDKAKNEPGKLRGYLKQRHIQGLDEGARTAVLSPSGIAITSGTESQVTSTNPFSETPVGAAIPGTYRKLQLMPNEQLVEDSQGNQFIQSKDTAGKITIRPVTAAPNAAPAAAPPPAAPAAAAPAVSNGNAVVAPKQSAISQKVAQVQTTANLPDFSQPVPPRYPVRQAGQPVFNLQQGEKEAQEAGGKYLRDVLANRGSVNPIIGSLEKIVTTTNQLLQDTISKAGKGLTIEQYFNKLLDDSKYKELSKQLARLQLAQIANNKEALSSDAGKQMSAAATGSEVYPPEVLQKIAVQTYGEMQARDRLGVAADKYARKYGENNMASFGQMWDNNSDAKIFELMALPKLIKDPKAREKMTEQIIGYPVDSKERKILEQKYINIKKLIENGDLK